MSRVVLCPNMQRDKELSCTKRLRDILIQAGHEVVVSPVYGEVADIETEDLNTALEGASLLVSLGGDGTILHLAPLVMTSGVPLVGVNLGHKGFLTELDDSNAERVLEAADGSFELIPRMMLDVEILRDGKSIFSDTAINEAVISGIVQNVRVEALGDGERILDYSGDGIIVSTPTGSTAYSMSAGGPLVEPGAENIILTPICAHMLAARSFVLAPERVVTISPLDLDDGKRCVLSVDGRGVIDLFEGDHVIARRSANKLNFAYLGTKSFYETAFEKLGGRI